MNIGTSEVPDMRGPRTQCPASGYGMLVQSNYRTCSVKRCNRLHDRALQEQLQVPDPMIDISWDPALPIFDSRLPFLPPIGPLLKVRFKQHGKIGAIYLHIWGISYKGKIWRIEDVRGLP